LFLRASAPWFTDQYSAYDYIVGGLVAAFILGLSRSPLPQPTQRVAQVIRWLAGASFGLYLLHYPFLRFFSDVLPWSHDTWTYRIALFALSLSASIGLARVFEQTKDAYRTALHRMFYYFRARLVATGEP
jgi:peptidoglycan/LPS O-acetylase OafA/YrhL